MSAEARVALPLPVRPYRVREAEAGSPSKSLPPPPSNIAATLTYTNNACERALRPSVIFRKVTNCFRAEWGAKVCAAAASVIATGRLHGLSALEALQAALAGAPVMRPG